MITTYRYDIKRADLGEVCKKGKKQNSYSKDIEDMYLCPECNHHAFYVGREKGRFHCWRCGVRGRLADHESEKLKMKSEKLELVSADKKFANSPISDNKTMASEIHQFKNSQILDLKQTKILDSKNMTSEILDIIREDYMPLSSEILDEIKEISLAPEVTGAQLEVRKYLEAQQIPLEMAVQMGWGVTSKFITTKKEKEGQKRTCLAFRNYVEGYCCNVKYRCVSSHINTVNKDGGTRHVTVFDKGFMQDSSFTPCAPYGIDCLRPENLSKFQDPNDLVLYITEGEKDACTLRLLGCSLVVSVANGANGDVEKEFQAFRDWLKPITVVCIVGDQDVKGRMLAKHLSAYFSDKTVCRCKWDQRQWGKDISDIYQRFGTEQALAIIESAERIQMEGIEDYDSQEAKKEAVDASRGLYDKGYDAGVGPITNRHFRLTNSGGLVIVTGTPNTGKTDFLNYLTMSLVHQTNNHVCYCSFETPNKRRHAGDLAQMWAGGTNLEDVTEDDAWPFVEKVTSHITHLEMRKEKPTLKAITDKTELVIARHPDTRYLIIDPYLFVQTEHVRNETDAIKDLLTQAQDWGHAHKVWVFIVAHPRKLKKEDGSMELEEIDYYTISGSANWANIADFVLSLKRIQKEKADYTRLSVLKVRDQKICIPGDVFYKRQFCGRYDECNDERDAIAGKPVSIDPSPWRLD